MENNRFHILFNAEKLKSEAHNNCKKLVLWNSFWMLFLSCIVLSGCSSKNEVVPASIKGLNYTPHYINRFAISNEKQVYWAGGGNIVSKTEGEFRSEGGSHCCIGISTKWKPDTKVVIQWNMMKAEDGEIWGRWYEATAVVPAHGPKTAGVYVYFLPNDYVRVQVGEVGKPPPRNINSNDPFLAQGVVDERRTADWRQAREENRALEERALNEYLENQKKEGK